MTTTRLFIVFVSLLGLSACDEQNVLYSVPSKETIPPVPGVQAPAAPNPHGAMGKPREGAPNPHAGMAAAKPTNLPEVASANFTATPGEAFAPLDLKGVQVGIPERWQKSESANQMRVAQYAVPPKSGGGEAGEFVVFYFGAGQGGGALDNIARWAGQFKPEGDAKSPVQKLEAANVAGLSVTRVVLEGTYAAAPMMQGAAAQPKAGWGMDALIVEGGPMGSLFYRLTGPSALVKAEGDAMLAMASSARRSDEGTAPAESMPAEAMGGDLVAQKAPGLAFMAPAAWESQTPSNSMRVLQYGLRGRTRGEKAELVAFYFGQGQGGDTAANIDRWIGQMKQPDGASPKERAKIATQDVGPLKVTRVDLDGTYTASMMGGGAPMAGGAEKENYTLIGFVVEGGPKGTVFFKLTGPKDIVEIHRDAVAKMIESLKPE